MNVYDFDGTIYNGNSYVDFGRFLLQNNREMKKYTLTQILNLTRLFLNKYDTNKHPSLCNFLSEISNLNKELENFWDENYKKLLNWYKEIQRPDDLVITSSFEFLVIPACNILNIRNLIGTKVNLSTGDIIGKVCIGDEKVRRFKERYGEKTIINKFYTDSSLMDKPLIDISKNAVILKKGNIVRYM